MNLYQNTETENARVVALNSYAILDTLPEKEYDDITFLASMICDTPMALISLIDKDRQWLKSNHGFDKKETPREFAFCAHAINDKDNTFVVNDARIDERFQDNPMVTSDPNLVFYAGVPLKTPEGHPIGTLCVLDVKPKVFTESQKKALEILSNQVLKLLELRKSAVILHRNNQILRDKNKTLDKFVSVAAHDIKSPINNILSLSGMLIDDYSSSIDSNAMQLLDYIKLSAEHSTHLIDGILSYSKDSNVISEQKEFVNIKSLLLEVKNLLITSENIHLTINVDESLTVYANKTALHQIFSNLISNGIKYNHEDIIKITINAEESDRFISFNVKDNGSGIKQEDRKKIFKLFATTSNKDRDGFHGTGIGLATVKNLIQSLGGKISVYSKIGSGANFKFTIQKEVSKLYA